MWTPETWKTEEDVERDIILLAEYNTPAPEHHPTIPVPDTIFNYRRTMAQNKEKVLNADIDESATYIVSGRGKGIRDRIIRPGGIVECHPLDDVELKKQIRQVSGFGYSNELIEQSFEARRNLDSSREFKMVIPSSGVSNTSRSPTLQEKK